MPNSVFFHSALAFGEPNVHKIIGILRFEVKRNLKYQSKVKFKI
jgi:hypothetical protein